MHSLKNLVVLLCLTILTISGNNKCNAASIIIKNVNIIWQYEKQATNFSISAVLAAGVNPGKHLLNNLINTAVV